MAKGNMFLSQARGKVGSVVFSVIRGQQVERVHNAHPANPRSFNQQAQRALLANMTKFYKRGTQNFYRFAFEDKTIRESDFNAFARHNMQAGVYMPKELYDHSGTPALGKYIVSDGSISTNIKDYFSGENYGIHLPGSTVISTVGALSSAIMAQSPQVLPGDIFTMVVADSEFGAEMMSAGSAPTWAIHQFFIDASDLRPLSAVGLTYSAIPGDNAGCLIGVEIAGVDRASFGATVISRNTEYGLMVSKSELKGSAVANVLFDWLRGEYMRRICAASWGGNPEAVLQGGQISSLPEVTGLTLGASGTTLPAYQYGVVAYNPAGAGSSEIEIFGTNLRTTAQGGRYVVKFYSADILSDGLVTEPVIEKTYIATAAGDHIALTAPTGTTRPGTQFYMLVEIDGVPVWYGLSIPG